MSPPIKTSHGIAILTACLLAAVILINSADRRLDQLSQLTSMVNPRSQLAQVVCSDGDLACGLIGLWPLDSNADDTSGNGNNGSFFGSHVFTTGVVGNGALSFDGTNYITLLNPSSYPLASPMSASIWAYPTGSSASVYWALSYGDTNNGAFLRTNGSSWQFAFCNANIQVTGVDFNQWQLMTGTYDGTNIRLYKNGILVGGPTVSSTCSSGSPVAYIGNRQNNSFQFLGTLDDARIYNYALSAANVSGLYVQGSGSITYTLNVTKAGTGTGTITGGSVSCGSTCSQSGILPSTQIVLTAAPDNGGNVSFQGCTSSTATTCTVTISSNTTITATFSQPVSLSDLSEGLIAYYTFDEGSGTTFHDSSFNNNDGTFVGSPVWTAGKIGSHALQFDGVSSYATTNSDFIGTTPITFCSWIYPTGDIGQANLISNGEFKVLFGSNNRTTVTNNNSSYGLADSWSISLNVWQHECVTRDLHGLVNIYINGSLNGGANQSGGPLIPGSIPVHLGTSNWSAIFPGKMDDVRVYNRVLSAAQIAALYTVTSSQTLSSSDNRPPNVSVNNALTSVTLPTTVNLPGVVTDDGLPSGSSLTYAWTTVSTPVGGTVTFNNPNIASTTATLSQPGDYLLELTASDSQYTTSAVLPITAEASLSAMPYTSCGTDCYLAATISTPDIGAAIDAAEAANGGTIEIPAGTGTITSPITKTITKDLVITGMSSSTTIINDDVPGTLFTFTTNGNTVFRLTDMKIVQVQGHTVSGSAVVLTGNSYRQMISNIYFDHVGEYVSGFIQLNNQNDSSNGGGVIYGNTINMHSHISSATGIGIIGSILWANSPDWGSPYKWYIEDNRAEFMYEHGNDIVDSYRGAEFVFRHNIVDGTSPGGHGYDSDLTGVQNMEIYDNTFTSNFSVENGITRAGTALIWGNRYTPPVSNSLDLSLYRSVLDGMISGRCNGTNPMDGNQDSTGYPCYHQPGMTGDGLTRSPLIEWDNKMTNGGDVQFGYNGNLVPPQSLIQQATPGPDMYDHVKEGRDYLNDTTCTTGPDYSKRWVADSATVTATCAQYWDNTNHMAKGYVPYTYPDPRRSNPHVALSYPSGVPQYTNQSSPYMVDVPSFVPSITTTSAIIKWEINETSTTHIEYGLTTAYGSSTSPISVSGYKDAIQTVSGLSPGTLYHYRFKYTDGSNNNGTSRDGTFTTLGSSTNSSDTTPPSVPSGLVTTSVTSSSVSLSWSASTDNVAVAGYKIYRNGVFLTSVSGTTYTNSSLSASTQYTYAVSAYDTSNNPSAKSSSISVTTPVANSQSSYTLTYTANAHGSLTGTLTQTVNSGGSGSAVTAVPATGYQFTSWSDNSTTNPRTDTNVLSNVSVSASFTASGGSTSSGGGGGTVTPTISNIKATAVSATSTTIVWKTDLPATSQILYGLTTAYGSQTAASSTATTTHNQTIRNLLPNTIYHFKVLSALSSYVTPISSTDMTFTTGVSGTPTLTPTPTSVCPAGLTCTPVSAGGGTNTSCTAVSIFTRSLTLGSIGSDVRALQVFLNGKGFVISTSGNGSPNHETTYFGLATQAALSRYQVANRIIPSTGYFGPLTQAFIAKSSSTSLNCASPTTSQPQTSIPSTPIPTSSGFFTIPLKLGSTGVDVKQLQVFLNSHGYIIASTGNGSPGRETTYYGPATAAAISRFQLAHASQILAPYGLSQGTGNFGPSTMKVVNSLK